MSESANVQLCECGCGHPTKISLTTSRYHGFVKGQPRRFVKGHNNRGHARPESVRKAIASTLAGRPHDEARRAAIADGRRTGKQPTISPEAIARRSAAVSEKQAGKKRPKTTGEGNGLWKGDDVGYSALHIWVARHKTKSGVCEHCGLVPESRTEWANVSGRYLRDLDDFIELCPLCHRAFDEGRSLCV